MKNEESQMENVLIIDENRELCRRFTSSLKTARQQALTNGKSKVVNGKCADLHSRFDLTLGGLYGRGVLSMKQDREWLRQQTKNLFEAKLETSLDRTVRTQVHGVIPHQCFSAASSECREMFIEGHFYGCITLAQAVAEGLSRFVADVHGISGLAKDPVNRVSKLQKRRFISAQARAAFKRIWSDDRNIYHHLNENIETNPEKLEARAEECVNALYEIESELFAFDIVEGAISPKRPKYWPKVESNMMLAFLRLGR